MFHSFHYVYVNCDPTLSRNPDAFVASGDVTICDDGEAFGKDEKGFGLMDILKDRYILYYEINQ